MLKAICKASQRQGWRLWQSPGALAGSLSSDSRPEGTGTAQPQIQRSRLPAASPPVRTLVQSYHNPEPSRPFCPSPASVSPGWGGLSRKTGGEGERRAPALTSQLLAPRFLDSSEAPCLPAPLIAARAQLAQLPGRLRRTPSASSRPVRRRGSVGPGGSGAGPRGRDSAAPGAPRAPSGTA